MESRLSSRRLKSWISTSLLGAILVVSVVLPATVVSAGLAASTGLLIIVAFYFLTFLPSGKVPGSLHVFTSFLCLMVIAVLLILVHGLSCAYINPSFDFQRFASSFAYLVFFLLGAVAFALIMARLRADDLGRALKVVFYLLLLTSISGIFAYSPWFVTEKPVFFFPEPSHFALVILPFLLYAIAVSGTALRILLFFCGLLLGAFLENLTLFIGILLVAYLLFGFFRFAGIAAVAALFLALSNPTGMNYYLARLDLMGESSNLSVLVYRNGWEKAQLNLVETSGLGIGLNQLGYAGASGKSAQQLREYAGAELNAKDGGTVAAKLVNEFGIFGIVVLAIYLGCFARYSQRLRARLKEPRNQLDCCELFFLSSLLTYSVDLFVRGTGYFSVPSFLLVASLVWIFFFSRHTLRSEEKTIVAVG
jgi:hypothetical protein